MRLANPEAPPQIRVDHYKGLLQGLSLPTNLSYHIISIGTCNWRYLPSFRRSHYCWTDIAIRINTAFCPLGYHGLGDIFVFIFFGLAAVAGTYYVHAGSVSAAVWWMTIPPGLIITAILVVNNLRDIENDRKGGKHTLAVRIGERATKIQYLVCMVFAYLILPFAAWIGIVSWFSLLAWGSLPLAFRAALTVLTQKGRPLNVALAGTGQAAFVFSVLFWVGMVLFALIV